MKKVSAAKRPLSPERGSMKSRRMVRIAFPGTFARTPRPKEDRHPLSATGFSSMRASTISSWTASYLPLHIQKEGRLLVHLCQEPSNGLENTKEKPKIK